jgi:hypothetical protein
MDDATPADSIIASSSAGGACWGWLSAHSNQAINLAFRTSFVDPGFNPGKELPGYFVFEPFPN